MRKEKEFEFERTSVEFSRGPRTVEVIYIGEGCGGDYGDVESDIPQLRFYVKDLGKDIERCSYCTCVDARRPYDEWLALAIRIMDETENLKDGELVRRCQQLSWLGAPDGEAPSDDLEGALAAG